MTDLGALDLATAGSRKADTWKNKTWRYTDLVQKLSVTHRTAETFKEYLAMSKDVQDTYKDVGGFVGGYLNGGSRKLGSIVHRQLLTLDADFAVPDFWGLFQMFYGCEACLYSTHKHTPDTPRYRLIIPLDRPVDREQYQAIIRRVAGDIGIEMFDNTGFQPERLMYWPSTAKDGVFEFQQQSGAWLSADQVLATYRDWRDISQWPVSERVAKVINTSLTKQEDPLTKTGVVGAFCRTYTISEAIATFLSDLYVPADFGDRYTWARGSGYAGVRTYDNKFSYSEHDTDPTSKILCNAFDLVRLHLYGDKDTDSRQGTASTKLPSYLAMLDMATADKAVKLTLGHDRMAGAQGAFDTVLPGNSNDTAKTPRPAPQSEPNVSMSDDWLATLDCDRKGNPYGTLDNMVIILKNDPLLRGLLAYDEFEHREVLLKSPYWRRVTPKTREITDNDDANIKRYLEKAHGIYNTSKTKEALQIVSQQNTYHPVRDYLNAQSWDRVERLDTLFIDYLGAVDDAYTRAVTRKSLIAAVARVMQPGVKVDNVLVLVGRQGRGKSTILGKLGRAWFSDSFTLASLKSKEAFEQLQGVWLIEIGELAGLHKGDIEHIKGFISKQSDRFRVAYGHRAMNFPRQCVFFATTNRYEFLRDIEDRRFWPVDIDVTEPSRDVFRDLTNAEIGQIWAEAVEAFKGGEKLHLTPELTAAACTVQAEHGEEDPRAGMIEAYLNKLLPENWADMGLMDRRVWLREDSADSLQPIGVVKRDRVCVAEIWNECLGDTLKNMTKYNTKDLHDIMLKMSGWKPFKSKTDFRLYGTQRAYKRKWVLKNH